MVNATVLAIVAAVITAMGEWLHGGRVRSTSALSFGPFLRPGPNRWARLAPTARVAASALACWGFAAALEGEPSPRAATDTGPAPKHLLIVLDVSGSMRACDCDPRGHDGRYAWASKRLSGELLRLPAGGFRTTIVAIARGQMHPVAVEARDRNIVRNVLGGLPLHLAFEGGYTELYSGLSQALQLVRQRDWLPRSATLVLISDGDTGESTALDVPEAIEKSWVLGVGPEGSPSAGSDGAYRSCQVAPCLKSIARQLGGTYIDYNRTDLPWTSLAHLVGKGQPAGPATSPLFTALAAVAGSMVLATAPLALWAWGSSWRAGASVRPGHQDKDEAP
jgi:hypothetical protein